MGSMSLSSSLCQRGRVGVKPRQPGWLGLALPPAPAPALALAPLAVWPGT